MGRGSVKAIFRKKRSPRKNAQAVSVLNRKSDAPLPPVPEGPKTKQETRRGSRNRRTARRTRVRNEKRARMGKS
jgi:hypothetical protein